MSPTSIPANSMPLWGSSRSLYLRYLVGHNAYTALALQVENESPSAHLPSKQGTSPEQTSALEESIMKVSRDLSTVNRNQKYFRTRENRNFSTVKSTEARIFNFSVVESGLMVCMAGLQVFIVRFFFQGARKGKIASHQRVDLRQLLNRVFRLRLIQCQSII